MGRWFFVDGRVCVCVCAGERTGTPRLRVSQIPRFLQTRGKALQQNAQPAGLGSSPFAAPRPTTAVRPQFAHTEPAVG